MKKETTKKKVELRELAYFRSGDKGDISNVGVMALNRKNYEILLKKLTPESIKAHYKGMVKGDIEIYPMPNLNSIEVVMHNALGGGAPTSLRFGQTGKPMGNLFSLMEIELD